ncbi:hypothetical protein AVEN_134897-1 [Araneus ventricosus]|uniref:Reverse transcriptase domain-containing protein n=1 Tax=Araneus ventricosus TaxID=182803 RepID=A0A4Y2CH25_ARAVE|nr:hypothetical protein AVEN_134897-1 [Araneus ventricosus]
MIIVATILKIVGLLFVLSCYLYLGIAGIGTPGLEEMRRVNFSNELRKIWWWLVAVLKLVCSAAQLRIYRISGSGRSSVRSSITKLVQRVQALGEETEDLNSLSELLELIETKEEILKKYDSEVEDLITDPEKFKVELKGSEEYDDKILSAKIKLKSKLKTFTEKTVQESHSSLNKSNISENAASALKLPKLEIPRFSGDSNFMEFFGCFDSAIGSNDSLSKIEKFQYLKSLLSPPAYNVVAGFELNEKNYDSCLELLKQRYGRIDFIINSYMSKLLNLEPVRNSSHVKSLRRLYDEIEVNIRNLRALNVTEGSYGHLLNPLLLKLLPQDLVLEFHRGRSKDKNCEVSEIMTFLRNEVESREISESVMISHNNVSAKNKAFLQTCSIYACSDKRSALTNAILDSASHKSFISAKLVKALNLKVIRFEELAIYSFGQTTAHKKRYPVVCLQLQSRHDSSKVYKLEALVIEIISNLSLNNPDLSTLRKLKEKNIQLADSFENEIPVDILVGSDSFWDIVYDEKIRVTDNIWLINSCFGWLLGGVGKGNNSDESCQNVCLVMDSSSILFDLSKFWEIEEFPNETRGLSERDDQLIRNFENNLEFNGQRYVCKLMWKENMGPPVGLDSNYEVAKKRFNSLCNKLNKNPEISDQYKQIVKDQLESNIVGKCVNEDIKSGYYMPHRAVIRDDKITSQVRIVYDCSSKANEDKKSLNDSLETGVNLYVNILDAILKFRENQVAFCGDLEKAFLMIEIAEEDRKYLKFLWFPNDTVNSTQTFQLNRLPFGLTTSPFALACVLKFHIKKFKDDYPKCYEMLNSLYVDDLYYGAETAQDAYQLTSSAIEILRSAGFNLRKLRTNCSELNKLWCENGYEENTDHGQGSGFLGLNWDPIEDKIKLNLRDVRNSLESGIANGTTKRHVLRIISQIFDPCGLISPFVITVKILMQELWEKGLKWDEQLPSGLEEKWRTWCSELAHVDNLQIERKLFSNAGMSEISLHVFCDASPKAYGAVAYFRYITEGRVKVSFIISKSKVAPLKTLTLARLELMAALIAARLAKYLLNTFPSLTKEIFLWSDSKIVLHWLKGSSKIWKPFVSNRVAQVQLLTPPNCWNHCSGSENPADFTTRGESTRKFLTSSLWWMGPAWLSQPVQSWPVQCLPNPPDGMCGEEVIASERRRTAIVNTMVTTTNDDNCISGCIDIDKYSNLGKLLRVTAWVRRFIHNAKPGPLKLSGPLCASELQEALYSWIKATQLKYFGRELKQLLSKGIISKDSSIYNLNPELDDNQLLQLKGR